MPDHEEYTDLLDDKSFGYFLYHPKQASVIKPGACGYIDSDGHFHLISSPGGDQEIETEPLQLWEPVCQQCQFKAYAVAEANAEFPGLPAGAGVRLEFISEGSTAAALLTASVRQRFIGDRESLKEWVKDNSEDLLKGSYGKEIKRHGLWVIDRTYMTPKCSIAFWHGEGKTLTFGLSASAYSAAKLTTSGNWQASSTGGSWRTIPDRPAQEDWSGVSDDDCEVVSIMGVRYNYSHRGALMGRPLRTRGEDDFDCDVDGEKYDVEASSWENDS